MKGRYIVDKDKEQVKLVYRLEKWEKYLVFQVLWEHPGIPRGGGWSYAVSLPSGGARIGGSTLHGWGVASSGSVELANQRVYLEGESGNLGYVTARKFSNNGDRDVYYDCTVFAIEEWAKKWNQWGTVLANKVPKGEEWKGNGEEYDCVFVV